MPTGFATAAQGLLANTALQPGDSNLLLTNVANFDTVTNSQGRVDTHAAETDGVHGITAYTATLIATANASAARTVLELGTAATTAAADYATAAQAANATTVAAAGAVMDSDIAEAEGFMRKTGAGSYVALKTNLGASVAPTATDDSGDGYAVGSQWIDTTADKMYVCVDATASAAVWQDLSAGGGGGAPLITSDDPADAYPQTFVDYMVSSNRAAALPSHAAATPSGATVVVPHIMGHRYSQMGESFAFRTMLLPREFMIRH